MVDEQPVTEVFLVDFIGKTGRAVSIGKGGNGGDLLCAVFFIGDVGIIQGIHIYSQSIGMPGQLGSTLYHPVIEAGGIIVFHGSIVISVIGIN